MKWQLNILPKEAYTVVLASGRINTAGPSAQAGRTRALTLIQSSQTPAAASSQQAGSVVFGWPSEHTTACAQLWIQEWGWPVKCDCHCWFHTGEVPTTLPPPHPCATSTPEAEGLLWSSPVLRGVGGMSLSLLLLPIGSQRDHFPDSEGPLRSSRMSYSFLPMFYSFKLQSSLGRQGRYPRNLTNDITLL